MLRLNIAPEKCFELFQECVLPQLPNRRYTNSVAMSSGAGRCTVLSRYTNRNIAAVYSRAMPYRQPRELLSSFMENNEEFTGNESRSCCAADDV